MKNFNENSRCKKCGYDVVGTTYRYDFGFETMHRKCARCGYTWCEAPLDAQNDVTRNKSIQKLKDKLNPEVVEKATEKADEIVKSISTKEDE